MTLLDASREHVESRVRGNGARPVRRAAEGRTGGDADTGPQPDPYTEHPTREGKVYCAVVLDVFSRRVVGWSIDASPPAALVTNALRMVISYHLARPRSGNLHPFRPRHAVHLLDVHASREGLRPRASMGSIGDSYDNAMIESFCLECRSSCPTARAGEGA